MPNVFLQGSSAPELIELIESHGGRITHDLPIIDGVGAQLSQPQLDAILQSPIVARVEQDISTEGVREDDESYTEGDQTQCGVAGSVELTRGPTHIEWNLFNRTGKPASLTDLDLAWPAELGRISSIELGPNTFDAALWAESGPGSAKIRLPSNGETQPPRLVANGRLKVGFDSKNPAAFSQREFSLILGFDDDCEVALAPLHDDYSEYVRPGSLVGADLLHKKGVTGAGVTVAVIDSGLWETVDIANNTQGEARVLARYNAISDTEDTAVSDESGHGTHISSIIANSDRNTLAGEDVGHFKGIAPDVNLVPVKVFGDDGEAYFLDIVRAIQWVVDNKETYDIGVINVSFAARPRWPYWLDPINQALMRAWDAGITVVAAAGNSGPDLMTVGSPGNLPFIITVGAVSDSWTAETKDDDYIPDFSSRGPTPSGHIKPDIVAPGANISGVIRPGSRLAIEQPELVLETGELLMTGSSQATALVSGIAALLLQANPGLSPNEVKCKLLTSAEPAINDDGLLSYSPFQQGHGYVSASRALTLGETACGISEIDIERAMLDHRPTQGPAIVDAEGKPSLPEMDLILSPFESEQGLSQKRKWGIKDHIERLDGSTESEQAKNRNPAFDWMGLYELEQQKVERLSKN